MEAEQEEEGWIYSSELNGCNSTLGISKCASLQQTVQIQKILRSEVASSVRLSCGSSYGSGTGSDALLWPQPRMAQHLAWLKLLVSLHGTEITLAGSNTATGDIQNEMCLLTLVKVSVLRRDVTERIISALGTWNYPSLLLEQHQPSRDDISAAHALPTLW